MKFFSKSALLALSLGSAALLASIPTTAEDIDIFVGASTGAAGAPNILIVLDNTSNWSRQSQQWPGGVTQGQSEANAIKTVIQTLGSDVNIGLMEFVTGGTANDNGGFIRQAIAPMNDANKAAFSNKLTTIYNNITSPDEKRNANTPYGNLMYDAYNYFAGGPSYSPNGVLASLADTNGYSTAYTQFKSPLSADNSCARSYVIFIGNPNHNGPASDASANTTALSNLGGDTTQLRLPEITVQTTSSSTTLGNTTACYSSKTSAQAAYGWGLNTSDNLCQLYSAVGSASGTATDFNATSCTKYSGTGTDTVTATDFKAQCSTFTQGCVLGDPVNNPTITEVASALTGYLAAAPAATAADAGAKAGLSCPADAITCSFTVEAAGTAPTIADTTADSNSCYYVGNGSNQDHLAQWTDPLANGSHDYGTLTCPADYTCTYTKIGNDQDSICTQQGNVKKAVIKQTATPKTKYKVTRTITKVGGTCPVNTNQYVVLGKNTVYVNGATTGTIADTGPRNADEWSRFLYKKGIPLSGSSIKPSVTTYTIDVYNKQPNAETSSLLWNMAKEGGGKYFSAKNEQAIVDALKTILVEIQAVNSTFASTSLPVNATNRTQNENQVFIGMFRPDPGAKPRWFGNLKRYQLINDGGSVELGDSSTPSKLAVNTLTGFLTDCAVSFWTSGSGKYWENVTDGGTTPQLLDTATVKGGCPGFEPYSDLPDGPLVEKGAVAEILRQGNNPPTTTTTPTWAVNRTMYTISGNTLTPFTTASSGLSSSLVDFILGKDVNDEKGTAETSSTRPSIHGDVIHSRPLPVNYGGTTGITVFYGANDGTFRAVDAATGKEKWAFVAPEFFSRLSRLMTDSPLVSYPNTTITSATAKDYFFDGSTGVYQDANLTNPTVWIFPTMRRGGRMIYAFDVSNPNSPSFKWKAGCPNLSNDTGCTTGMEGIGQTWSSPNVALIKGYSTTTPILAIGGGYDTCEDADTASPTCTSTKGGFVYILNANTGEKIASFATSRSVASDVSFVDIDGDGYPDYAYAADTGGNIYRIDFINNPTSKTALDSSSWTSRRVAYTNGAGRKFLFAPAVFANSGKVYLAIGSGDREHPLQTQYPYTSVLNRFYMYKDDLATTTGAVNMDTQLENYSSNTSCATAPVLPNSTLKGWYMDLNQNGQGEQTVTSALIAGGMVTFSTNRPVTQSNSCSTSLGEARGYWVNLLNASGAIGVAGTCGGTRSSVFVGGGLPPSPVLANSVPIGNRATTVVIGAVRRNNGGASVSISPQEIKPTIASKRKRVYSYTKGDN
jgi:hypothetical protein